jgi:hypothetical protein
MVLDNVWRFTTPAFNNQIKFGDVVSAILNLNPQATLNDFNHDMLSKSHSWTLISNHTILYWTDSTEVFKILSRVEPRKSILQNLSFHTWEYYKWFEFIISHLKVVPSYRPTCTFVTCVVFISFFMKHCCNTYVLHCQVSVLCVKMVSLSIMSSV